MAILVFATSLWNSFYLSLSQLCSDLDNIVVIILYSVVIIDRWVIYGPVHVLMWENINLLKTNQIIFQ